MIFRPKPRSNDPESSALEGEIFEGITSATIEDIHAYLADTFSIVKEETHFAGATTFNIDEVPESRRDEAIEAIREIVGDNYSILHTIASNEDRVEHVITISKIDT